MTQQVASAPPQQAFQHLITVCGQLQAQEKLLLLCDKSTLSIAECLQTEAEALQASVSLMQIDSLTRHGQEPPPEVAEAMSHSDLIMSVCTYSLAHSRARIRAGEQGARFLSMPGYSEALLSDPAVLVDYPAQASRVRAFADAFTQGKEVLVTSAAGTHLTLDIRGRVGNACAGFVSQAGDLGSPPDIEANVSPVEDGSFGKIVIDGSITCDELGLLTLPVILYVEAGRVTRFESENAAYVAFLETLFGPLTSKRRVVAECGVGLNPEARLTGIMLTDEGTMGCLHFGLGANHTVGGQNEVDFHLDFVLRKGSLAVDGVALMQEGVPLV